MGRFINDTTGAIVSVSDKKDYRFESGWHSADTSPEAVEEPKRGPGRPKKADTEPSED